MGSWNATCGITQLPIIAGDRVVAIPLVVKQHDFLSRDSLAGSGSCDNDVIAQPFALPVAGVYDDYGGVKLDDGQEAVAYLNALFEKLVKTERLMTHPSGKPTPVKKVKKDLFELLTRRELLVTVPNARKGWLKQLHETYASLPADQKKGMSHYKAQMEVDPDTLPDTVLFGLGIMMVPEALYLSLADTVGAEDAYGHYDHAKDQLIEFKGIRRGELANLATLDEDGKTKIVHMNEMLERPDVDFKPEHREYIRSILPPTLLPHALEMSMNCFFFDAAVSAALKDIAANDSAIARKLWVDFMLFRSAMNGMRKHWTPQTGAGSSCGLYETHKLYKVASDFVSQALTRYTAEAEEDE
jgi:hypothetical protein